MSGTATVDLTRGVASRVPLDEVGKPVTQANVVRAEWIKFRTLRSSWAVLGAAVVGMIVIGLLVAHNTRHLAGLAPEDAAASGPLQGYFLGQLLIGALGVLFVTGEYSTGMIRSSFAAVPKRLPVLWAKLVVFTVVVGVSMVAASVVAFVVAQAYLSHYRTGFSLGDPGALRVAIGTGVYLTLVGLIGAAAGWIVRSTPGALVTYIALMLVVPVLFGTVLGTWGKDVAQFFPGEAGGSFVSMVRDAPSLSPWVGLGVMIGWVVAGVGVAAVQLRRRDA
jgi:ABC-type transport system involved in multi-copper enzyme maturation permease subunit